MRKRSGIFVMSKAAGFAAALFFGAMVVALPAVGQGFTVEQAMDYPFPDELTAAVHGERVAWVFNARGARNVWIADGPNFAARQVTHYSGDEGMPIASLRLTPDGNTVVYARGSEMNEQGEVADPTNNVNQPQQQVWAADVANGEPRLLGTMNCAPRAAKTSRFRRMGSRQCGSEGMSYGLRQCRAIIRSRSGRRTGRKSRS